MSIYEIQYIKRRGIKIFKSCDDLSNLPQNFLILFKTFFGGLTEHKVPIIGPKLTEFMKKEVLQIIKDYTNRDIPRRKQYIDFNLDPDVINSGDVILLQRMDGLNAIIEIGSGSRSGHCVIALRKKGDLFICESKSSSYFPVNGIRCNKWEDWIIWSKNSDLNLVLLPLKKDYQKKFDLEKAWKFVEGQIGNDYGFHNFFFGWIDTINHNMPDILDLDYLMILLSILEKVKPSIPKRLFLDAFNKRLNTQDLTIDLIWEEIYKRNTTIQELSAQPELEEWNYNGQTSYTCSSFVTAVLKNAGVFGFFSINSTEFTPKDLYELDFWELNKKIKNCEKFMEDGYCQFLGEFRLQLGKTSFVKPYDHMAEKCPTISPDFTRKNNCQFLIMYFLIVFFTFFQFSVNLLTCESQGPDYFKMISKVAVSFKPTEKIELQGHCFKFDIKLLEENRNFILEISALKKKSFTCFEFLIFSSGKTTNSQVFFREKSHRIPFNSQALSDNEISFIKSQGLKILKSCDESANFPVDIYKSLKLFVGGMGLNPHLPIIGSKIWEYQLSANIEMVKNVTGFQWKRRFPAKTIEYPKSSVQSGDILMITRFDGIDNIIHIGSGSRIGHSTIAIWKGDKLFVCESQAALYFPRENIQCNEWDTWIKWAENADYNVIIMPLKRTLAGRFNVDKAWEYINGLLGTPYGFHNFLFGWIDTPDKNLPPFLDFYFVSYALQKLETVLPDVVDSFLLQAMSKRLGKEVRNVAEMWEEMYERGISIGELMAMPEQDKWTYKDGKSLVCSSFVAGVLRAGGLFQELDVNVTEMTPEDVVAINFWDNSGQNFPEVCKGNVVGDYCQIMGNVQMDIGKTSFLEPYTHMSEKCPSQIPDFKRTPGC